ncbi:MAG: tetratricopeptide repeat protein [Gemmatimonadales bacterium]|nr:tetratricopeptide repeat protein [Gemmatimonadales bacterium]
MTRIQRIFRFGRWGLLWVLVGFAAAGCAKKVLDYPVPSVRESGPLIIEHRVAEGETLRLIADNYYGDPARASDIALTNGLMDPDRILPGSFLRLHFAGQEWDSARRRAAALEPYNRGVDLLAREQLGEAERQFRFAIDTAPELVSARYNLALVLVKRGRNSEALPLLEELTAQRPEDTDFLFARGHALFLMTRFDEAVDQFRLALAVKENHQRAAFSLARSLQEAGHVAQARAAWQRYLDLDDTSSWATAARRHLQKLNDADGE